MCEYATFLPVGRSAKMVDVRTFAFYAKAKSAQSRKVIWLIRSRRAYSCATAHDFHVIPLFQSDF